MPSNNSDGAFSNILVLISNFNKFLKLIENPHWARRATSSSIKNSFKLATFIEKVIENFNSKNMSEEFLQGFKDWLWQNEQRSMTYEIMFFQNASDSILDMFLFNKAIQITSADIALRIYTSFHTIERFHKFLKDRILKYSTYNNFLQIIVESPIDIMEIEVRIMLKDWEKLMNEGKSGDVKTSINEMFSDYKLSKSLYMLLKILCIKPESSFQNVKHIIMEKLQEKLSNQSVLNKVFWKYTFKELDPTILINACAIDKTLTDSLLSFIEYSGSMMIATWINSEKKWIPNEEYSLFPEISYSDLFKIIKKLYELNSEMKDLVILKIADALKVSSSDIWEDILFSL